MFNITHLNRFNRVVDRFSNLIFRAIDQTPAVQAHNSSEIVIYSVLGRRHVNAYLVALKSLLQYCPDVSLKVVIQDDSSLDTASIARLHRHVKGISIIEHTETMQLLSHSMSPHLAGILPSLDRMCFFLPLKLLNVIYRYPNRYVILFDSDLLFLKRPQDVVRCFGNGSYHNFHSPGGNGLTKHFIEMNFEFPTVEINQFNAGFFGFFNSLSEADLIPVLSRIAEHDSSMFSNWEIEQALWAVLLNRCGDSICLKDIDEHYVGNGWRTFDELRSRAVMVHFVGATRFRDWTYPRLTRQVIRQLQSGSGACRTL